MLSIHPSYIFPHFTPTHTHTQRHTHTQTHTHMHSCCTPSLSSMLIKYLFCSILRHVKNLCSKHSPYGNQFISFVQLCMTVCNPRFCSTPGFLVYHQLPELAEIQIHWILDAILTSHPLSTPSPWPSFLSSIRIFSNETVLCIRWTKNWSFSFSVSPSSE